MSHLRRLARAAGFAESVCEMTSINKPYLNLFPESQEGGCSEAKPIEINRELFIGIKDLGPI